MSSSIGQSTTCHFAIQFVAIPTAEIARFDAHFSTVNCGRAYCPFFSILGPIAHSAGALSWILFPRIGGEVGAPEARDGERTRMLVAVGRTSRGSQRTLAVSERLQ